MTESAAQSISHEIDLQPVVHGIDLQQVMREIETDVRERRARGGIPAGLERELDLLFARFAPAGGDDDLDQLVERADHASFIDADVPTVSRLPGVSFVKKLVRKLTAFSMRYLAQQVSGFGRAVVGALRQLSRRVSDLEAATPGTHELVRSEVARLSAPASVGSRWEDAESFVRDSLDGVRGRVLCGDSDVARILSIARGAGCDAYAVSLAPSSGGTREVGILEHLRNISERALSAVVLVGAPDRLSLGGQLELADLIAARLADDGRVVVLSRHPAAWMNTADVVEADLTPGRPLHAETWIHLLEARGFVGFEHRRFGEGSSLARVAESSPDAAEINESFARLERLLFQPERYAVRATRAARPV